MTYYDDLVSDKKRVSSFKKVIDEKAKGIVYDLGTGSGILAQFASKNAQKVYAIEQNPLILKHTRKNISNYENIELINTDASKYIFPEKADVIICEMLDTALIDEEQVPVINNAIKYKKDSTIFIPKSVYSTIQLSYSNIHHITYYEDEHPKYEILSDELIYQKVNFSEEIDDTMEIEVSLKVTKDGLLNSIKITTYTIIMDDVIIGPTPMLNPPLLVPLNHQYNVKKDEIIILTLKYVMGGGLNTIQTSIRRHN